MLTVWLSWLSLYSGNLWSVYSGQTDRYYNIKSGQAILVIPFGLHGVAIVDPGDLELATR